MKWKERSAAGRVLTVLSILLSVGAVISPLLYGLALWEHGLSAGILLQGLNQLCKVPLEWNTDRKLAWLSLAAGVFVVGCSVAILFLQFR